MTETLTRDIATDNAVAVLNINWGKCAGRGLCIELLEEKLSADQWGYPYSPEGSNVTIPAELLTQAREAAAACPLRALMLTRKS